MGILPHTDIDRAIRVVLSLDIPFWPQLPKVSYFEDMYVQALDHFPGVRVDPFDRKILFNLPQFYDDLPAYLERGEEPDTYRLTKDFSLVYHRFLERDLLDYPAIRGQMISPISLGLKIVDQDQKPIIYQDEVRGVLFDFIQKKVNLQYRELRMKNPHAFVWLDDPGLGLIFNALSGYNEVQARGDLDSLLKGLDGPRGIHLCAKPDWDFLLRSKIDILSFDSFSSGEMITHYPSLKDFFNRGGIVSWGIVPTYTEQLERETPESLMARIEIFWGDLVKQGVDKERLLHQSLLAPATCNLLSPDKEETVERAFDVLKDLSISIRTRYALS
jgi:hypothetical protein